MKPNEMLDEASRTRKKKAYVWADDYVDAIIVLRETKDYGWSEIRSWMLERGVDFTVYSIKKAYQRRIDIRDSALRAMSDAKKVLSETNPG